MSPKFTKIAFLILLGLFSHNIIAQRDLIVTQAGEKIRCRILDETPTRFVYAYLGPNNKVLRSEIFKNLVGSFKYNEYPADIVKQDKLPASSASSSNETPSRIDTRKTRPAEKKETGSVNPPVGKEAEKKETARKTKKEDKKDDRPVKEEARPAPAKSNIESAPPQQRTIPLKKEPEKQIAAAENRTDEKPLSAKVRKELNPLAEPEQKSGYRNFMKFRIGVKAGLGNVISKPATATEAYSLYKEKLYKGWVFGADASYFITDFFGIGGVFTNFQTKNKSDKLTYPDLFTGETVVDGSLSNHVSHKFIGPVFYFRKSIDFKTYVVLGLSPGMHFYTDRGMDNVSKFKFKGQAYGAAATLGLDFLLGNDITGRDVILSLEGGYNYGQIKELNYGDGRGNVILPKAIDLNRLDFSVGLRFMRFPGYLK